VKNDFAKQVYSSIAIVTKQKKKDATEIILRLSPIQHLSWKKLVSKIFFFLQRGIKKRV